MTLDEVDRPMACAVCGRRKGPGKLLWTPNKDEPGILVPIHGGHRIMTIFRAGISLHLMPLGAEPN
jgi:hypothetical protein